MFTNFTVKFSVYFTKNEEMACKNRADVFGNYGNIDDAKKAWEETTSRGAESYFEPKIEKDDNGEVVKSGIKIYGDTVHIFV